MTEDEMVAWHQEPGGLQPMGSQSQTLLKRFSMHAYSVLSGSTA